MRLMDATRPSPATIRDDVDRVAIAGSIAVLWLVAGPLVLVAVLFAGYALWLSRAWARIPLAISGLALAGLAISQAGVGGQGFDPWTAVLAAPGLVIALFAMRVRIGPPVAAARQARAFTPVAHLAAAPSPYADIADDPALLEILDTVAHLDRETTRLLAAAWKTVKPQDRDAAWASVHDAIEATGRAELLEDVRRQVELWGRSAGGSPWTWQFGTMTDVDRGNIRRAAMPAILDAAAAVLARDRLSPRDLEILAGPWDATLTAEPAESAESAGSA